MATIRGIINRVDELRPNAFSEKLKLAWISELEGKIAADVMLMQIGEIRSLEYSYPEGMDVEPMVSFPHQEIYTYWLQAQIDYANGEYNKYQNSMEMYNQHYGNFVRWFANSYEPAQGYQEKPCSAGWEDPPYYVTAYGMALKGGFQGSLDEWLKSLQGPKGDTGKSAYEVAVDNGFVGTETEWLDHLKKFYITLFPSQTVDFWYTDYAEVGVGFSFEVGQEYLVTLDGKQYLRKCEWAFGEEGVYNEAYVGNKHLMMPNVFPDNGDPFYMTVVDGTLRIYLHESKESQTIEIRKAYDIVVDSDLSETSENPVQNKVVTAYLNEYVNFINEAIVPRLAPNVTTNDDGKFLQVKNGILAAVDAVPQVTAIVNSRIDSMFVSLSQDEYDALVASGAVDANKYYLIVGDGE